MGWFVGGKNKAVWWHFTEITPGQFMFVCLSVFVLRITGY